MDIQTANETIKWAVNGVTILLMVGAAALAIRKKNNLCLGVAIVGNLLAYYLTQSPLLCMIISIACIIWASMSKNNQNKPDSKVLKSSDKQKDYTNSQQKHSKEKMIKCRFCNKSYSAEYNGCPHCKKV